MLSFKAIVIILVALAMALLVHTLGIAGAIIVVPTWIMGSIIATVCDIFAQAHALADDDPDPQPASGPELLGAALIYSWISLIISAAFYYIFYSLA